MLNSESVQVPILRDHKAVSYLPWEKRPCRCKTALGVFLWRHRLDYLGRTDVIATVLIRKKWEESERDWKDVTRRQNIWRFSRI